MALDLKIELFRGRNSSWGLCVVFLLWKALLIVVALASPGPGYDTSTTLLRFSQPTSSDKTHDLPALSKLVRWDAIYFVQIAQRGHVFEQEWAFGKGLSNDLSWISRTLFRTVTPDVWQITMAGVVLSHLAHFGSVILVQEIVSLVHRRESNTHSSIASVAALLYIVSPAGIFLSAPYSESAFAFRTLLGLLLYLRGVILLRTSSGFTAKTWTVLAGAVLGQAAIVRSNGILAGLLFAVDALDSFTRLIRGGFTQDQILRLAVLVFGGILIGYGFVVPQYEAYYDYCIEVPLEERRVWCGHTVPSIYTFVQSHYWNVGPFRYWTLSNLPLFAVATPALILLIYSSAYCIPIIRTYALRQSIPHYLADLDQSLLWRLAAPQLAVAILAVTSYHVQIITRLSSGYPLWYIWLAALISTRGRNSTLTGVFRWMVLYALIQASLYASFLPPA